MAPHILFPTTRDLPVSLSRRILDSLLNLIYPESCLICSEAIARQQDCGLCADCWENALRLRIAPPWCVSCGLPIPVVDGTSASLCASCILRPPPYAGARSFGYYTSELGGLVQALKFHGRRNLVGLLAPLLASAFYASWTREEFDLVVSIPLHAKRRRERGYNQAELLARTLARQIALPFSDALVRIRSTLPQIGLTQSQRLNNVRKAFHCNKSGRVSGRRVLLIDDVMTTGATAASASRALVEAGSLRVSVLTVARAVHGL